MTKDLAIIICSKKETRPLEDYALTLAGIPPLKKSAAKALAEDEDINNLYLSYLSTLQQAVVVGDLKATQNIFSDNAREYICKYQDFIGWAVSTGYMTNRLNSDTTEQDLRDYEINPAHAHIKARQDKDKDAHLLIESKPYLLKSKKAVIKNELMLYSPEFHKGFEDWWKTQNIFKKDKAGRPPKNK